MRNPPPVSIYRLPAVLEVTGLSKATVYRLLERGEFPPRVKLSPRCVGWRVADVDAWLAERAAASGVIVKRGSAASTSIGPGA